MDSRPPVAAAREPTLLINQLINGGYFFQLIDNGRQIMEDNS